MVKTPVTQRSPCYSAVSALLMNPLPDCSNYSPHPLPHSILRRWINTTSLVSSGQTLYQAASWRLILQSSMLQRFPAESSRELEEAEQQAEASVDVPYPPIQIVNSAPFCLFSLPHSSPSLFSLLINSLSS